MSTNAIINRNHTDYSRRLALKRATKQKNQEIEDLKTQVSNLTQLVNSLIAAQKSSSTN